MGSPISSEFSKLIHNKPISVVFLVPIMKWASGSEKNIEVVENVNRLFNVVDKDVLVRKLALTNKLTHFLRFPKEYKKEESQFFDDICKYYGWTRRELDINKETIDLDFLKKEIPKLYGYDKKEIKQVRTCSL